MQEGCVDSPVIKLEVHAASKFETRPVDKASAPSTKQGVVVLLPAFNEVETIRDVVERTLKIMGEVIVVDDGSIDGTSRAIKDLPITLLKHDTNKGKAASLWLGFQVGSERGPAGILSIDSDGQHAPEEIPLLLQKFQEYPESIIIGSRKRPPRWFSWSIRIWANKVADFWLSWAAGYRIVDSQSGFRIYPVDLLQRLKIEHSKSQGFVFESEVLIEAARLKVWSVPVETRSYPRQGTRRSHFRPVLDVLRITKMVAGKLLSRGMYFQGLYHVLRKTSPSKLGRPQEAFNQDAENALCLPHSPHRKM